jgi:timeless
MCEKNKSMFVELLFWKTSREAQEIQDGYGSSSTTTQKTKADRAAWTKDEENELELLAEEYNALPDEGDFIRALIM